MMRRMFCVVVNNIAPLLFISVVSAQQLTPCEINPWSRQCAFSPSKQCGTDPTVSCVCANFFNPPLNICINDCEGMDGINDPQCLCQGLSHIDRCLRLCEENPVDSTTCICATSIEGSPVCDCQEATSSNYNTCLSACAYKKGGPLKDPTWCLCAQSNWPEDVAQCKCAAQCGLTNSESSRWEDNTCYSDCMPFMKTKSLKPI